MPDGARVIRTVVTSFKDYRPLPFFGVIAEMARARIGPICYHSLDFNTLLGGLAAWGLSNQDSLAGSIGSRLMEGMPDADDL